LNFAKVLNKRDVKTKAKWAQAYMTA